MMEGLKAPPPPLLCCWMEQWIFTNFTRLWADKSETRVDEGLSFFYYSRAPLYLEIRTNRSLLSHWEWRNIVWCNRVDIYISSSYLVISETFVRSFRVSLLARCFRSLTWNDLRRKVRLVELELLREFW